ncbi:MAG TPA: hypothetical protein VFS58_10860, partial [Steroidobacteraceae bacterium]|nr:hypothetical protein [Steroidobacteraceae bacterium]
MNSRICLLAPAALVLASCTPGVSVPDGSALLDEGVSLQRDTHADVARREVQVGRDSVIVAIVDENADVKVRLQIIDDESASPVEVENNLRGAGMEVAVIEAEGGSRIAITLAGPPDAKAAGDARLRLLRFEPASDDPGRAAQVAAFKAWSSATGTSMRGDAERKSALSGIDRAIEAFELSPGDSALAAQARLVKANTLLGVREWRDALMEAQRAASAFDGLPKPDALGAARAHYLEAITLSRISTNRAAANPTADEAIKQARVILARLAAPDSAF